MDVLTEQWLEYLQVRGEFIMKIDNSNDGMTTKSKEGRQEFCWNCQYFEEPGDVIPCKDCFGTTPNGTYYAYKNWKKGID